MSTHIAQPAFTDALQAKAEPYPQPRQRPGLERSCG
jgi:hypothetical protein